MPRAIALLGTTESLVATAVAAELAAAGAYAVRLDIDAPLNGEPVTVRDRSCVWQGCDLTACAAIWLEQPVFPWPQALPPPCPLPDAGEFDRWRHFQREARSLALSAIAVAAERVRVCNPPASAHLAICPTAALDELAAGGLSVLPWRVAAGGAGAPACSIDAVGRDRWHRPADTPDGAARLVWDEPAGQVTDILVLFGADAGRRVWSDSVGWCRERHAEGGPGADTASADAASDLAVTAAAALGLDMAVVSILTNPSPTVLTIDAAPDLADWDARLSGRAGRAVARGLAAAVADIEGASP